MARCAARARGGFARTKYFVNFCGYCSILVASTAAPAEHPFRFMVLRQGLIPDEPVLQLATFLRSHDLFLELRVRTPRTLTANQARQGDKQGTDGRGRSRIHFRCLALTSLLRSLRPKD